MMGTATWVIVAGIVVVVVIAALAVLVGLRRRREVRGLFGDDEAPVTRRGAADGARSGPLGPGVGRVAGPGRTSGTGDEAGPGGRDEELHPLAPSARERYQAAWDRVQSSFVDRPALAVHDADTLLTAVMAELGYPVDVLDDPQGRGVAGPSHGGSAIDRYRSARRINLRADSTETSTDELRHAFVEYRSLFDELISAGSPVGPKGTPPT
jgi:hypothetical protein